MKKSLINQLLLLCLISIIAPNYADAQNYDDRCFIAQFEAGTTQAEIDALLSPYNLLIEDGPTTAFNNQFALICVDPVLGFPDIPVNSNGQVDINGVIVIVDANDVQNDDILDAIGLNFNLDPLAAPSGGSSHIFRHPLASCRPGAFTIDTAPGTNAVKLGVLDTGIKVHSGTGLENFFDPTNLGWNTINDTSDPADDNGHGCHVSSNIVLATPQSLSAALQLKAYKTIEMDGSSSIWRSIKGINEALLDGVRIINISSSYRASFDHRFEEVPLKLAIEEAGSIAGILFVASAGNNGMDNDNPNGQANYPASFMMDNMLAVSAVDCNAATPIWSNRGTSSVDIAAPGVGIWGLDENGLYVQRDGTSFATALTSRLAAILATQQSVFDYKEIKCAIINGANHSSTTPTLSQGYLDATKAQMIFNTGSACSVSSLPTGSEYSATSTVEVDIKNGQWLNIDSDKEQVANLRVFNMLGQLLHAKELQLQAGPNSFDLEIPKYHSPTTYVYQLQYGTRNKTLMFVR
ncbi:MAG: S8 family serine peptidase [Bacteroidota bacterium]